MTPAATETEIVELSELTNLAESGQREYLRRKIREPGICLGVSKGGVGSRYAVISHPSLAEAIEAM